MSVNYSSMEGDSPRPAERASYRSDDDDDALITGQLSVSVTSLATNLSEDRLRRRLKYFFMNPCQKWAAKRKIPWKLMVQFLKVVLVTIQLVVFGLYRSSHVDYLEKTAIALKHLYLKDWTPSYETMPYPPSMGAFAVYDYDGFYTSVTYAISQYNRTEDIAIGTFSFVNENNTMTPPLMCLRYYRNGQIFAFNESFIFNPNDIADECFPVEPVNNIYNIETYLLSVNKTLNFDGLIDAKLLFSLKTVHLKSLSGLDTPDCYRFDIVITYDNQDHSGQMTIKLTAKENYLPCRGTVLAHASGEWALAKARLFDIVVMFVCLASLVMCLRSMYRALLLGKIAVEFFASAPDQEPLRFSDKMEFVNIWYIMIVFNDILSIAGCIAKLLIESKVNTGYEVCGVLLGTANLLVWCGVLRYLGFYENYNILLRTIKRSFPSVARFLLCSFIFYFGFVICGWVVLGPYHIKFRSMSTASECLFSLMNGDDIFTTFATMVDVNTVMWWYSRAYLYIFVSLFIYVILSVFISVIMDTYENIKREAKEGLTKTRLQVFADECCDEPHQLFADRHFKCSFPSCSACLLSLCCCHRRRKVAVINENVSPSSEYTALVR